MSQTIAPRRASRGVLLLLAVPSFIIATILAVFYLVVRPLLPITEQYYFPQQAATYAAQTLPLYLHVTFGAIALIAAAVNILRAPRGRFGGHRTWGTIYAASVAVSAPAGAVIAFQAYAGTMPAGRLVATSGFLLLAVAWLASTVLAVRAILSGDRNAHGSWMIISFALVFAAVTLRAWLGILMAFGTDAFEFWYPALGWLCWVPNLVVALLIVRRRMSRRRPTDSADVSLRTPIAG